ASPTSTPLFPADSGARVRRRARSAFLRLGARRLRDLSFDCAARSSTSRARRTGGVRDRAADSRPCRANREVPVRIFRGAAYLEARAAAVRPSLRATRLLWL